MKGQWLGSYQGSVCGSIMINVDDEGDHYEAVAYLHPNNQIIPSSVAYLQTSNKDDSQLAMATIYPIDPSTGFRGQWSEVKKYYSEDINHSEKAEVQITVNGDTLTLKTTTDIGVEVSSILNRSVGKGESKIKGQKMSWANFKSYISQRSKDRCIYRGQEEPWSLCTRFHRSGRYRIDKFVNDDVRQLYNRLSAITSHFFDLTIPDQNGAFFNLLQHHGYPTPLLDWSYSPYVAAFFAFRGRKIGYEDNGLVRIYIFDPRKWQKKFKTIQNLDPPVPHLSVLEFIAINNPRLVPQQAVTTATNVYDVEGFILGMEKENETRVLEAIDIPANEREEAMQDLRFMGITAGSMFPGIDGVCEELRERNFDK